MSEKRIHEGHRARLRETFISGDAASRADPALLELLLSYAIVRRDVTPRAKSLLARFRKLHAVLAVDAPALQQVSKTILEAA